MNPALKAIDCLILCGGLGRRLTPLINDRPKPMAAIAGQPFLELLVGYLSSLGIDRFIFCLGYKGQMIQHYFRRRLDPQKCCFSKEQTPLGTGGAIKLAQPHIRSTPFMVVNGDSICQVNLARLLAFHLSKHALATLTLAKSDCSNDSGVVTLHPSGRVTAFNEKSPHTGSCFINAGVYLFSEDALATMPTDRNFSLEYEWFPKYCCNGLYGFATDSNLTDIGTPERFRQAQHRLVRYQRTLEDRTA